MLLTDLGQGQNFGRADNRRIHARCAAVVEKDGIQHNPGGRRKAKAHIANPQNHMDSR